MCLSKTRTKSYYYYNIHHQNQQNCLFSSDFKLEHIRNHTNSHILTMRIYLANKTINDSRDKHYAHYMHASVCEITTDSRKTIEIFALNYVKFPSNYLTRHRCNSTWIRISLLNSIVRLSNYKFSYGLTQTACMRLYTYLIETNIE